MFVNMKKKALNVCMYVCKSIVQCQGDDPDVIINYAAVAFKEGNYESARTQYSEAINTMGTFVRTYVCMYVYTYVRINSKLYVRNYVHTHTHFIYVHILTSIHI